MPCWSWPGWWWIRRTTWQSHQRADSPRGIYPRYRAGWEPEWTPPCPEVRSCSIARAESSVHPTTQLGWTSTHQWGFDGIYIQDITEGPYVSKILLKIFLLHLEYHNSQLISCQLHSNNLREAILQCVKWFQIHEMIIVGKKVYPWSAVTQGSSSLGWYCSEDLLWYSEVSEILCPEVLLFPRWLCSGVSALGLDPRASGCLRTSGWETEITNSSSLVLSQPWPWTHSSGVWTSFNINASVLMVFIPYQELRTRRENFLLFLLLVSTASFSSKIAPWNF